MGSASVDVIPSLPRMGEKADRRLPKVRTLGLGLQA